LRAAREPLLRRRAPRDRRRAGRHGRPRRDARAPPRPRSDRMTRVWLLLALLVSLFRAAPAEAQHIHGVEPGEALASIAQLYFGDPKKERALRLENQIGGDEVRIVPGMRLQIPFVTFHKAAPGDTWASLAAKFYGDERRDVGLRFVNRGRGDAPDEGA